MNGNLRYITEKNNLDSDKAVICGFLLQNGFSRDGCYRANTGIVGNFDYYSIPECTRLTKSTNQLSKWVVVFLERDYRHRHEGQNDCQQHTQTNCLVYFGPFDERTGFVKNGYVRSLDSRVLADELTNGEQLASRDFRNFAGRKTDDEIIAAKTKRANAVGQIIEFPFLLLGAILGYGIIFTLAAYAFQLLTRLFQFDMFLATLIDVVLTIYLIRSFTRWMFYRRESEY